MVRKLYHKKKICSTGGKGKINMHFRTSCFYGAGRAEKANADDTFEKYLINADGERVNPACAIYGSNATGKASDAQIICATHDVEMLDLGLFRRDQGSCLKTGRYNFQLKSMITILVVSVKHRIFRQAENARCVRYNSIIQKRIAILN